MIKFLKDFNSPDYVERVMRGEAISVLDIMHDPKEAFKDCEIPRNIKDLNILSTLCWDRRKDSIQARIKTFLTFGRKKYRQVPHYSYVISMCLAYVNYRICIDAAKGNDWKPYLDAKSLIRFPSRFWYMVWLFGSKMYISMMNDKTFSRKCSDHWRCSPQYYNLCVWGDTIFVWKLKKRIARIDKEFSQLATIVRTIEEDPLPVNVDSTPAEVDAPPVEGNPTPEMEHLIAEEVVATPVEVEAMPVEVEVIPKEVDASPLEGNPIPVVGDATPENPISENMEPIPARGNPISLEEIEYNDLLQNELFKKYLKQIPETIYKSKTDQWECPNNMVFVFCDAVKFYCQMENPKFSYVDVRGACAKHFGCTKKNIKVAVSRKLSAKKFDQSNTYWNTLNNLFPEYVMINCPKKSDSKQENKE